MKEKKIYFISGVSGVGKTSVMTELQKIEESGFDVHDFDERGVPDAAGHDWRRAETRYWIGEGIKKNALGLDFVVCGVAHPIEIKEIAAGLPSVSIEIIFLDADDEVIEQRLRKRNEDKKVRESLERAADKTFEKFLQDNTNFAKHLREVCRQHECVIVDTTNMNPEEVSKKLLGILV